MFSGTSYPRVTFQLFDVGEYLVLERLGTPNPQFSFSRTEVVSKGWQTGSRESSDALIDGRTTLYVPGDLLTLVLPLRDFVTFTTKIFHLLASAQLRITMKVLVTGATGTIGRHALLHALLRPEITSIVALSRRDLPADISNNPKLKVIILKDFNDWPQDILEEINDADAMIW